MPTLHVRFHPILHVVPSSGSNISAWTVGQELRSGKTHFRHTFYTGLRYCRPCYTPNTIGYKYGQFQSKFGFGMPLVEAVNNTEITGTFVALGKSFFFLALFLHFEHKTTSLFSIDRPVQGMFYFKSSCLSLRTTEPTHCYTTLFCTLFIEKNGIPSHLLLKFPT